MQQILLDAFMQLGLHVVDTVPAGTGVMQVFNRPGPKAGSIHSIEVSVCLRTCLSVPIYFFETSL